MSAQTLRQRLVPDRWTHQGPQEVVLLDNRDSFVYNLAHRLHEVGVRGIAVARSDEIELAELLEWSPRALVVSPGPGHPDDAGISVAAIKALSGVIPILGVCLGHQAIARAFGARVIPSLAPRHGMSSLMRHDAQGLLQGLPDPMEVGRYHSLVVESPLLAPLEAQGWCDGFIMAMRHRVHPTFGVQFHPESVLSPQGRALLARWAAYISSCPIA